MRTWLAGLGPRKSRFANTQIMVVGVGALLTLLSATSAMAQGNAGGRSRGSSFPDLSQVPFLGGIGMGRISFLRLDSCFAFWG